jgi:hypothetical protein
MIAGAVTYDCSNSFLHQFQQLDLASKSTIGSFGIGKGFMCNGANLAYKIFLGAERFWPIDVITNRRWRRHYGQNQNNIITTKWFFGKFFGIIVLMETYFG